MEEIDWIGKLEDARRDIEDAETDREAIVIVFTELSRLLLDLMQKKAVIDPNADESILR